MNYDGDFLRKVLIKDWRRTTEEKGLQKDVTKEEWRGIFHEESWWKRQCNDRRTKKEMRRDGRGNASIEKWRRKEKIKLGVRKICRRRIEEGRKNSQKDDEKGKRIMIKGMSKTEIAVNTVQRVCRGWIKKRISMDKKIMEGYCYRGIYR